MQEENKLFIWYSVLQNLLCRVSTHTNYIVKYLEFIL